MLEKGTVVRALSGRDKGGCFLVLGSENGRILIADGRRRTLQRPKAKSPIHLEATEHTIPTAAVTGNRALKKLLRAYHCGAAAENNVN